MGKILVAALMLANLPWQSTAASSSVARQQIAEPRYFPETGHYLVGPFRDYWESHGGLFVFGLPVTSQFAFPSTDGSSRMQALTGFHLSRPAPVSSASTTVHAPQSPSAHPSLVPVSRRSSRRYSSNVVCGRNPLIATGAPLSSRRIDVGEDISKLFAISSRACLGGSRDLVDSKATSATDLRIDLLQGPLHGQRATLSRP